MAERIGIVVVAASGTGVLHELTGIIARHDGDIAYVEIIEQRPPEARVYFEVDLPGDPERLSADLRASTIVHDVSVVKTLQKIFGKRIIIVGGGAQVGQVAIGAISESTPAREPPARESGPADPGDPPATYSRAAIDPAS